MLDADIPCYACAAFNGAASGCATGLVLAWGGKPAFLGHPVLVHFHAVSY